jgi:hypothetical protein
LKIFEKEVEEEVEEGIVKAVEKGKTKQKRKVKLPQKRKRMSKKETGVLEDMGSFFMNHPGVIGVGIIGIYLFLD